MCDEIRSLRRIIQLVAVPTESHPFSQTIGHVKPISARRVVFRLRSEILFQNQRPKTRLHELNYKNLYDHGLVGVLRTRFGTCQEDMSVGGVSLNPALDQFCFSLLQWLFI